MKRELFDELGGNRRSVPLCARVVDFETTGDGPDAGVIEVGVCDVDVGRQAIIGSTSALCWSPTLIDPRARAVHHIAQDDLIGLDEFDPGWLHGGDPNVFVAHNAEFEQRFFDAAPWVCTYKAALRVWPDAPSHGNGALAYWLEDQGKVKLRRSLAEPAHRAGPDAYVTANLFLALLKAGAGLMDMVAWSTEPPVLPRCTLGKFRGAAWPDVEHGFLQWIVRQPDMDANMKWNAQREIDRRAGERP